MAAAEMTTPQNKITIYGPKERKKLKTLADARGYTVNLPDGDQVRNAWQKAAKLLTVAAENCDGIAAAHDKSRGWKSRSTIYVSNHWKGFRHTPGTSTRDRALNCLWRFRRRELCGERHACRRIVQGQVLPRQSS
jgi:hypothetical protein